MLTSEETTFTLDNMGRFLCNTLQEAIDSTLFRSPTSRELLT